MPRYPALSGREVVRGLERLGFVKVSQSGSHIKLRKGSVTTIVPNHRELRRGTLRSALELAGVTIDDLVSALSN